MQINLNGQIVEDLLKCLGQHKTTIEFKGKDSLMSIKLANMRRSEDLWLR